MFNVMGLERFCEAKNISSKKTYAMSVIKYCVEMFTEPLYKSLVLVRTNLEFKHMVPLSAGRHVAFSVLIRNLTNTYYVVDGRNQNCSTKKEDGRGKEKKVKNGQIDKRYYNHKSKRSGLKSLVWADVFGKCVRTSRSVNCAIHDSHLYKIEHDKKFCPENVFTLGDGGFSGLENVLHPYRINKSGLKTTNTFITTKMWIL